VDLARVDPDCPARFEGLPLTHATLNRISEDLVKSTFVTCDSVLAEAGLRPRDLDAIFLAGGSTHLAKVREGVEIYFGKAGRFELEPTEVVALGASQVAWSRNGASPLF
jgi:molecular chaperone DnaK